MLVVTYRQIVILYNYNYPLHPFVHSNYLDLTVRFLGLVQVNALHPIITVFPYLFCIHEAHVSSVNESIGSIFLDVGHEIFHTVSFKAVYIPLLYIVLQNVCLLRNAAWFSFLVHGLDFSIFQTGILVIIGSLAAVISLLLYKHFLLDVNWRNIFVGAVFLKIAFSALQIALILQINVAFHIPNMAIAAGDDVLMDLLVALFFVPTFRMLILMCREGSEGMSYALLTSATNLAVTVSVSISTSMVQIWDVSNSALDAHEFGGLLRLHLLTTCCSLLPLPLVKLIPRNQIDQESNMAKGERSWIGGALLIIWIVGGIIYVLFTATRVYMHSSLYECE